MILLLVFPLHESGLETPNGLRYPRVGGTRERHFDGTSLKPRKLLENAQTPTRRVHAVLGALLERGYSLNKRAFAFILKTLNSRQNPMVLSLLPVLQDGKSDNQNISILEIPNCVVHQEKRQRRIFFPQFLQQRLHYNHQLV